MINPKITFIIPAVNHVEHSKVMLDSLLRSVPKDLDFEVIVVDNASLDGSAAMVRERFLKAIVIENAENRGFGAANNQAFAVMRGRYALLLNSDAILTDQAAKMLGISRNTLRHRLKRQQNREPEEE